MSIRLPSTPTAFRIPWLTREDLAAICLSILVLGGYIRSLVETLQIDFEPTYVAAPVLVLCLVRPWVGIPRTVWVCISLLFGLTFFLALGLLWSPAFDMAGKPSQQRVVEALGYPVVKWLEWAIYIFLPFTGAALFASVGQTALNRFRQIYFVAGVTIALLVVFTSPTRETLGVEETVDLVYLTSDTITLGIVGATVAYLGMRLAFEGLNPVKVLLGMVAALSGIVSVLTIGSVQAAFGVGVAILFALTELAVRSSRFSVPAALSVVFLLLAFIYYGGEMFAYVLDSWAAERFYAKLDVGFLSLEERLGPRFRMAYDQWLNYPLFGGGLGSYLDFNSEPLGEHPHNLLMEILAEAGLAGAVCFIALMWRTFVLYLRRWSIAKWDVVAFLSFSLVLGLVSAAVSGSIGEHRLLFTVWGGLIGSMCRLSNDEAN